MSSESSKSFAAIQRHRTKWWPGKTIRQISLFVGLSLSFAAPAALLAQTVASISGTISDPSGSAVAGATITVKNAETGTQRLVTTDDAGHFDVEGLPVGQYQIAAESNGFTPE